MKRTGSCLLVTGELPANVRAKHMRRALGDSGCRQILVSDREDVGRFLPESVSPDDESVRVIRSGELRRGVTTTERNELLGADGLHAVRNQIWDAVDDFGDDGTLTPGDLRASVDSLETFLDSGQSSVEQFISDVSRHVTLVNGITYFYLWRPPDSELVEDLTALVDARIEWRTGDTDEHRWILPDEDISTDWMTMS